MLRKLVTTLAATFILIGLLTGSVQAKGDRNNDSVDKSQVEPQIAKTKAKVKSACGCDVAINVDYEGFVGHSADIAGGATAKVVSTLSVLADNVPPSACKDGAAKAKMCQVMHGFAVTLALHRSGECKLDGKNVLTCGVGTASPGGDQVLKGIGMTWDPDNSVWHW